MIIILANPIAEPTNSPPIGPNGVINPAIPPAKPNFLASGKAFCIDSLINPSLSL